jgi:hypothetical protein
MSFLCPQAPDPVAAAQAQGAANKETAIAQSHLNNPNTYTPDGSQVWTDPTDPSGRPTLTQTLSPEQQAIKTQTDQYKLGGARQLNYWGEQNIADALGQNFKQPGQAESDYDPRFAPDQGVQTDSGMWSASPIQEDVNLAAAPGLPTVDANTRNNVTQALYDKGARYLDPQFAQMHDKQNTDLSNQGIFRGSDAYNTAQDNLMRQQDTAYGDLRDRAIDQGGAEMSRDFGLGMQSHQQGVSDITSSGQFHNTAQTQQVNQLLADMGARNAALGQSANLGAQGTSLYNAGRAQNQQETFNAAMTPINAQSAIATGSQVSNPQFQPFNNNTQVAPPPIYQAATDQANINSANLGNFVKAGANIAGAAIMS